MLLLIPFSSTAKAVDYTEETLPFYYRFSLVNRNYSYKFSTDMHNHIGAVDYGPINSGLIEPQYHMWEFSTADSFSTPVSTIMIEKGDGFSVNLSNLYSAFYTLDSSGNVVNRMGLSNNINADVSIEVFSADGTYQNIPLSTSSFSVTGDYYYSVTASVDEVPTDVYKFRVVLKFSNFPWVLPGDYTYYKIGIGTDGYSSMSFKVIEEEKGLLKSIIEVVQNIKTGVTNLLTSIGELPGKLWSAIENGLKALFVPSNEYFSDYSTRWDTLLADRFGAIYQVGGYISDLGEVILQYATNPKRFDYLTVPQVSIPVGSGQYFEFGGYQVRLRVDDFEVVYDTLKVVTGIIASLAFINGLRKRYDEVMGVEK